MNSNCRLKSERQDKAACISLFAGLLAAVSLCGVVCTRSLAQEELELRPVDRAERAKQAAKKKEGAGVAAKVSPEVTQLIRKMISVRGSDQKEAEAKLLRMGLRVVPELRAWVRQVSGNTEKVEIVLRKIFRKVSGDKDADALVSRESSAGHFLEQLLASIGLSRSQVYITNMVKCRPPGNRDPFPGEIEACSKYIDEQIRLVQPKVIVTLGRHSLGKFLPGETIGKVHGKPKQVGDLIVYPIYHPAAALRRHSLRLVMENDFQLIPSLLSGDIKKVLADDHKSQQLSMLE